MARTSFRDRFFTPPVARAIMSPLGIVVAGIGTAAGVLTGIPLVAALGVGVAAWAGRVLFAMPKGKRSEAIDAYALTDPWRSYVLAAQGNRNRFQRTVAAMRPGPLHDRLSGVSDRFEDAVGECWRIASRGHDIEAALGTLDVRSAQAELHELQRRPASGSTQATITSLQAQLASANRMTQVSTDARDRLRLLDARMDELIARAAELSVTSSDDLGGLDNDVDGLVNEMEALRQAMDETGRASGDRSIEQPGSDGGLGGGEQSGGSMPSPGS